MRWAMHIHLVMWGAVPPLSLYAFVVCAQTLLPVPCAIVCKLLMLW
jgi:hypothetical protein